MQNAMVLCVYYAMQHKMQQNVTLFFFNKMQIQKQKNRRQNRKTE